jgi:hypothetical protein
MPLSGTGSNEVQVGEMLRKYGLDTTGLKAWSSCVANAQSMSSEVPLRHAWRIEYTSATRFPNSDLLLVADYYGPSDSGDSDKLFFRAYWGSESEVSEYRSGSQDSEATCEEEVQK